MLVQVALEGGAAGTSVHPEDDGGRGAVGDGLDEPVVEVLGANGEVAAVLLGGQGASPSGEGGDLVGRDGSVGDCSEGSKENRAKHSLFKMRE